MAGHAKAAFAARERLAHYIEALWSGREAAPAPLREVYTQRLAAAAKLASLLQLSSVAAARELLRHEDHAFPRELLATDAGREARAAFNLCVRAVAALEDSLGASGSSASGAEGLVGERLSAVAFAQDHVRLSFDGPGFTVSCPIVLHAPAGAASSGDPGFRDRLCAAIGGIVRGVSVGADAVVIAFDDHRLELLFGTSGLPEPLAFQDWDGRTQVFARRG